MRYVLRASIALVLSVAILAALVPATVFAANNEPVLTSIKHSSAVAEVSFAGTTSATLKVPYNHGDSLNLSQGLDIKFNTSTYTTAVPDFPNGATAVVGGDPVAMVVTYQKKGSTTLYTTTYSIRVERAEFIGPEFTGTISKTATLTKSLVFTLEDFTSKYTKNNGGDLASITITGSNPSFGTLKLAGAAYSPGSVITTTDLKNGRLTFSATAAGTVSYIAKAYAVGAPNDPIGSVIITITAGHMPPSFSGTITKTVPISSNLTLKLTDFTSLYSKNDGADLASITITGGTSTVGKLRLGTSLYSSGSKITTSQLSGGKLTFEPANVGTSTYTVKAYAVDDSANAVGTATLKIVVEMPSADEIAYVTDSNTPVKFDVYDFAEVCWDLTDEDPYYVKFTLPSSTQGKLYYDYKSTTEYGSVVSASTKYYADASPYLSRVSFVPKAGYTGTVSISYTGYNVDGESYSGVVRIIVKKSADAEAILYETDDLTPVTFDEDDFIDVCDDLTGEDLYYVKFTLPSSSQGKLYYDYKSASDYSSTVTSSAKYYPDRSPYLYRVTFVPKVGYSGTVVIDYTGYNVDGEAFTGEVRIAVTEVAGEITYTITRDSTVTFDATIFEEVCEDFTGEDLSYVKFKSLSSAYGTLYYDYTSSLFPGTKVSSSTKYYPRSSPYISRVTFVPKAGYTGTVTIGYTGYDIWGDSFTGTVKITVKDYESSQYFDDVDHTYWWCVGAVDYLFKKGITTGVSARKYNPSSAISRGDFVLMLCRALNLKSSSTSNFSDVAKNSHYYEAIATAKALGIAQGDGGLFRPNAALSRQDAMVLAMRALAYAPSIKLPSATSSVLSGFSDRSQIDSYATSAVAVLVKAGVIQGSGGLLNPKSSITRAEMAVILHRILTLE